MAYSAMDTSIDHIAERIESFVQHGSGWTVEKIDLFEMGIAKHTALSGGDNIPLPDHLDWKKYTIDNVPGNDGLCFKRAVYASDKIHNISFLDKNAKKYRARTMRTDKFYNSAFNASTSTQVNWDNITFPMTISQIP